MTYIFENDNDFRRMAWYNVFVVGSGRVIWKRLSCSDCPNRYGIMRYIDLVVASAEEGVAKPDKRIFEIALKRGNCKPDEAIMIGARIDNDIIPANLLGIHTIWVKQGFGKHWKIL